MSETKFKLLHFPRSTAQSAVVEAEVEPTVTEKLEVPEGEDQGDVCSNTYKVERPRAAEVNPCQ